VNDTQTNQQTKTPGKNKAGFVYDELRSQIITCTLQPGIPINEAVFAETLGVSKTPVREAIRRLEREGLVSSIAGRGSIVSYITSADVHETFEVREILECGAARHAATLDDKELFVNRRDALRALRDLPEDDRDTGANNMYDDMHQEIIDSVQNARLSQLYSEILDSIVRIRNSFGPRFSRRRQHDIIDEHIAVLDAIIEGDQEKAHALLRDHLRTALTYIMTVK
jgi:DNA-binding GntR family transcriptional regulator